MFFYFNFTYNFSNRLLLVLGRSELEKEMKTLALGCHSPVRGLAATRMSSESKASIIAALNSHNESLLLNIINDNPTWKNIDTLAYGFIEVAKSHPTDVVKIANTILAMRDAPDAPAINTLDFRGQPTKEKLSDVLSVQIYEMLKRAFSYTAEQDISAINPQNPALIAAMISGACARSKLCNSAAQAGMVSIGLQFDPPYQDYRHFMTSDEYEVYALHACLKLLVGGLVGFTTGQMGYYKDDVLPALRSMVEKDIIKSENGKNLFQVRYSFFKLTCFRLNRYLYIVDDPTSGKWVQQ